MPPTPTTGFCRQCCGSETFFSYSSYAGWRQICEMQCAIMPAARLIGSPTEDDNQQILIAMPRLKLQREGRKGIAVPMLAVKALAS
ncbi:hypothetical protein KIN20_009123 [Parelaphostrongylus tenuis]|uniref:Uncharacterized protein n=1 Tax=Parelaphostrongylus tenuis TaxID=148309 RepID=A0AAD5M911_PARTN|nr:hypothetical protein KIN20_009123 [Parelaphostrongylus tenuis]